VLKKGERVGYGGDFMAMKDMTVSTYDLGYGDGWTRAAYVTSENLAILGRVSMDFVTLASQSTTVCVMNDAQVAAKQLGTISYEVMTGLHSDIQRVII